MKTQIGLGVGIVVILVIAGVGYLFSARPFPNGMCVSDKQCDPKWEEILNNLCDGDEQCVPAYAKARCTDGKCVQSNPAQ